MTELYLMQILRDLDLTRTKLNLPDAGITNFDLIGNFGSMDWLGSFYLIFSINVVFAAATTLSLVTKFTATVRQEIYLRLKAAIMSSDKKSPTANGSNGVVKEEKED